MTPVGNRPHTLICLSFIKKCSSAAGRDFNDVQFSRTGSPTRTSILYPCICGPPFGNSKKMDKDLSALKFS